MHTYGLLQNGPCKASYVSFFGLVLNTHYINHPNPLKFALTLYGYTQFQNREALEEWVPDMIADTGGLLGHWVLGAGVAGHF